MYMKRTLLLLPAIASMSLFAFAQTPVDKTVSLQSIEIQGKRFGGLTGGEVKRLQVDSNLSGLTGTAADVFRLLPSVVTDIEGGIVFRGSSDPGLLMNGVPYGLMEEYSGDMLIQLPALFFGRVSMTATPSVEQVPDGDAGILDLSPAVYTAGDSPLTLTLGAGFQERYNAGAILNLHPGKFHIVGRYNYRREFRKRTFSKSTTNEAGTTVMNNNASARPDVHLADLSIGYDLTANDLLTVYGLYSLMDYGRYGKIHNSRLVDGNLRPVMFRHRYNDQRQEAYAAEARWNHTFGTPQGRLSVVFNYNNFGYDEDNEYKNEKPETGKIIAEDNYYVNQNKDNYYLSAVYGKLLADDWHLRVGYIGRFKDESYHASGNKLAAGEWQSDLQKENEYNFNRRTNLLLAALEKRWSSFYAEVGVQGELNWQKIDTRNQAYDVLEKIPMAKSSSRFHLFPRLKFGCRTDKAGELAFSYVQRVNRPYGSYLNVFTDRSDATHIWRGNPDLKDELVIPSNCLIRMPLPSSGCHRAFITGTRGTVSWTEWRMRVQAGRSGQRKISAIARRSVLNCPEPGSRSVFCRSAYPAISTGMRSTGARSVMAERSRWPAVISKVLPTLVSPRRRSCNLMAFTFPTSLPRKERSSAVPVSMPASPTIS